VVVRTLAFALAMMTPAFAQEMQWSRLPAIPDAEGFAASFAGVSGGALIVAGGANIVGEKWGESFVKKWYDSVFVLAEPDGAWVKAGTLPQPLGYGVSVTADDSVLCFGGSDERGHHAKGFRLRWKAGALSHELLPSLPRPCANTSWALVGRTIYVAGGVETPTATAAMKTFWALDLDAREMRWRELEPWPGPARMLAVTAAFGDSFYLMSGTALSAGADGKPVREYLRDTYRFTPSRGWERLPDLPRPAVAAPSPAPSQGGRVYVITGDDGANVTFQPVEKHPGFPRDTVVFDTRANSWSTLPETPHSRATVPVVEWRGRFVIPNGEVRPRVRTPEVWALSLHP
jgi:N-acetylneuraminate epimerase